MYKCYYHSAVFGSASKEDKITKGIRETKTWNIKRRYDINNFPLNFNGNILLISLIFLNYGHKTYTDQIISLQNACKLFRSFNVIQ